MRSHIEVFLDRDASETTFKPAAPAPADADGRRDRALMCLAPVTLTPGSWTRLSGLDRVRWANFFRAQPWAQVRVVPFTRDENDPKSDQYIADVSKDALHPEIEGAKQAA